MGCCTSVPAGDHQQGPSAPVKQPNSSNPNSSTHSNIGSARTVTVNGAKAAQANGDGKNGDPNELKGMARYEISPGVLGKGHFAVVKKCRDIVTGQTYAVKIIEKKELVKSSASVVEQEIEILKAVGAHPNIVQLVDHFEDGSKRYLVMEMCMGGDLFSQIVENGKYSEQQAAKSCQQLAGALKHLHSLQIIHRDLKPENILLTSPSPDSPLKLADFGLSKLIKGHLHPMRTVCVTGDHDVFVRSKGWISIKSVEVGDFVWSLAGLGREDANWSEVTNRLVRTLETDSTQAAEIILDQLSHDITPSNTDLVLDFLGLTRESFAVTEPLISFDDGEKVDLMVTRDHKMWTKDIQTNKWRIDSAQSVAGGRHIALGVPNSSQQYHWNLARLPFLPSTMNSLKNEFISLAWCRLIGYMIAKGSLYMEEDVDGIYKESSKVVTIATSTSHQFDEMTRILSELDWINSTPIPQPSTSHASKPHFALSSDKCSFTSRHAGLYDFFWPILSNSSQYGRIRMSPMPIAYAVDYYSALTPSDCDRSQIHPSIVPIHDWAQSYSKRINNGNHQKMDVEVKDPLASDEYANLTVGEVDSLKQLLMQAAHLIGSKESDISIDRSFHYDWRFDLSTSQSRSIVDGYLIAHDINTKVQPLLSITPFHTITPSYLNTLVDDLMFIGARAGYGVCRMPTAATSESMLQFHFPSTTGADAVTTPIAPSDNVRSLVYGHGETHVFCIKVRSNNFLVRRQRDGRSHTAYIGNCGTWAYCAPEVIQRKPYDATVDNWTLGVLMYILLSGYHPFDVYGEMPEPELLQKIIAASYDFDDPVWTNISEEAKDLIRGLLVLDPKKRLSLDTYLNSPWITGVKPVSSTPNTLVVERLSKFSVGRSKFRALAATLIASNKFKASISRSRANKGSKGVSGVPLLSNGEPDYLGLGSERNGFGPYSARSTRPMGDGLESVREDKAGKDSLFPITVSTRQHEPSNSGSASASGHTRVPVSLNHLDTPMVHSVGAANTNRSDRSPSGDIDEDEPRMISSQRRPSGGSGPTIHFEGPDSPNPTKVGALGRTASMEESKSREVHSLVHHEEE